MHKVEIIDLHFQNLEHTIASYLVTTSDGPILIDTGPYSTFTQLEAGVQRLGYTMKQIKHVFLTHIHLDHAGAAWALAQKGANIYLHPFGAKNMEDPLRLIASAKRIYKDKMDELWGEIKPILHQQLIQVTNDETVHVGDLAIKSLHTPGHARHHIAWQIEDAIFTGDVAGVKIGQGPVVSPCPPPDIHLEDWKKSIQKLKDAKPKTLYLTHYNAVTNIDAHLSHLSSILDDWAFWIKDKMSENLTNEQMVYLFMAYTKEQLQKQGLEAYDIQQYEAANPAWMSVAGLVRYWTKKEMPH